MRQNGGIEFNKTEQYRFVTIRESRIATTPRSSIDLIKRPVPCANNNAARGNEICINPLPPAASASAARAAEADAAGGSGFMQISLPRAALLLAQGTGRLIRSIDDRGVVAILDSRIVNKRYGSILLNSMPPFWRTNDGAVIKDALKRLNEQYLEG